MVITTCQTPKPPSAVVRVSGGWGDSGIVTECAGLGVEGVVVVRWGIIGCGDVTEVKSGPALSQASGSTLVAVMRRDASLAADYAARHGVPCWSTNADDIITAPDVDVVYVATPVSSHRDYTLRCAAAGKPVLVEKPMAMNAAEAAEMVAACRAAGVPLWVAYYRRALPRFRKVKELIDDGAIGAVRAIRSMHLAPVEDRSGPELPWRADPGQAAGGVFFDAACHTLDFLAYVFGPIRQVFGLADNQAGANEQEDIVAATYRFDAGVIGSGLWCYATDVEQEMNEVIGATGRLRFATTRPDPIELIRGDRAERIAIDDPPHVHQPLIQSIVDEINGVGRCPSTGETGLETCLVTDEILGAYREGRRRVRVG